MPAHKNGPSPEHESSLPERHLTVAEAARLLRISTRQVYDGVARKGLPHLRAGGRLLFEPSALMQWLRSGASQVPASLPPAVVGGSHDPLFEWAVRESGCGLALLTAGSADGIERLARGEVGAALVHLPSQDLQDFNRDAVQARLAGQNVALLQWAHRDQGWMVLPDNPKGIHGPEDLIRRDVRVALRQAGAGSALLLERLLSKAGLSPERLRAGARCHGEDHVAQAIRSGQADVGLGARAAAQAAGLEFIPVLQERLDLVVHRALWFEPQMQALWQLAQSRRMREQARRLGGYQLDGLGTVIWNAGQ